MPTYEYACKSCGEHLEVVQSFQDEALTTCPACQGELRKVFSAAGIIFKGSGWHIKDYKNGAPSSTSAAPGDSSTSGDTSSSDSSSGSSSSGSDSTGSSSSSASSTSSTSSSSTSSSSTGSSSTGSD